MKKCSKCGRCLPEDEFCRSSPYCKACRREYMRAYQRSHRYEPKLTPNNISAEEKERRMKEWRSMMI